MNDFDNDFYNNNDKQWPMVIDHVKDIMPELSVWSNIDLIRCTYIQMNLSQIKVTYFTWTKWQLKNTFLPSAAFIQLDSYSNLIDTMSIWKSLILIFQILIFIFDDQHPIFTNTTHLLYVIKRLFMEPGHLEITNFSLECRTIFWKCSPIYFEKQYSYKRLPPILSRNRILISSSRFSFQIYKMFLIQNTRKRIIYAKIMKYKCHQVIVH